MFKSGLIYYIDFVILSYIMGVLGDVFIKVIMFVLNAIIGVMESDFVSIRKRGVINDFKI